MSFIKKVVVVGAGGFGREVIEIFKDLNSVSEEWDVLGFIDDTVSLWGKEINGKPVLGGLDWLIENREDVGCVVAIGDPQSKKIVTERLEQHDITYYNAIHPSVIKSEFVTFGKDVIICAGVILTVNISIGDHVCINLNSTVGHDAVIENHCSIMPNVTISGNDNIGKYSYIGTGATIIERINIGVNSTIGAGAVVVKDIPDNVVAVGIPAKIIKNKEIHYNNQVIKV
ncbi:MAG TPA: acetyltransferase [Methanoculleus thermophilus]|nr:acetyltransferase [Methanoculleus thermophilus]